MREETRARGAGHRAPGSPAIVAVTGPTPFPAEWFDTRFVVPCPPPAWPRRFAVVTAHNPGGVLHSDAANLEFERELDRLLATEGIASFEVSGRSPDGTHREQGRGFREEAPARAAAIAARMRQLGFFWVEDGIVYAAVDGSGRGWRVGPWIERVSTGP